MTLSGHNPFGILFLRQKRLVGLLLKNLKITIIG
jgi:hypothetical protein